MAQNVHFTPGANLRLIIGGNLNPPATLDAMVCSKVLSRVSLHFKDLRRRELHQFQGVSNLACGCIRGGSKIMLPNDDPVAMKVLLHIIHLQFEHVPTSVTIIKLYEILLLCHKYGISLRIIRSWGKAWLEPRISLAHSPGNEVLVWIAWQLGAEDLFLSVLFRLFFSCEVNSEGQYLDSVGKPLKEYDFPGLSDILGT